MSGYSVVQQLQERLKIEEDYERSLEERLKDAKEKIKNTTVNLDGCVNHHQDMDTDLLKQRIIGKVENLPAARLAELARVAFRDDPALLAELPDKNAAKLPTDRPKYNDRKNNDRDPQDRKLKPPYYIEKYYPEYLDGTTIRTDFKHPDVDPPLYEALKNWLKKNDMPAHINLPTRSERVDREVAEFDKSATRHTSVNDFVRLCSAAQRRGIAL